VNWTSLAQDMDKLWDPINTVTNFHIPQKAGNFLSTELLLASQEGFCSMELVGYRRYQCIM